MLEFDNNWKALLQPGQATTYFVGHQNIPFQPEEAAFSRANAWWLAELSRLIYRQERNELGSAAQPPTRQDILNAVGLQEIAFFDNNGTQGALVASARPDPDTFAVLVFRGTNALGDWSDNVKALSAPDFRLEPWPRGGQVHLGFSQALERVWEAIESELAKIQGPLFYTGHSLGAALATLAASQRPPRALYTFGSPRVGNQDFAATLATCPTFRVVNNRDVVTRLPPPVRGLCHVKELHYIAHDGRLLTNPSEDLVGTDRQLDDLTFDLERSLVDRLTGPPQFLADHAPINYVAHLERDLFSTTH